MRRPLAAALLGISMWIGALAWSGFLMTRTVLDPDRSEDVADALLEDDEVRAQLVDNIAGGVEDGLPDGARVDRATLEAGAEQALESPEVETLVLRALVRSHRQLLGEERAPDVIDGDDFGSAARQSLVDSRPELDGLLPESPSLEVPLPTDRIPNLAPVRRGLLTAVPVLAAVAAVGALLSLLVTTDRPAVVRRAGTWAIGLSAFVLAFAYGVPALAHQVVPDQAEIVAALIGALAAATRWPALVLAASGLACIVSSVLWRRGSTAATSTPVPARRPSPPRDLARPGRRPPPHPRTDQLPVVRAGRPRPPSHRPAAPEPPLRSPVPDATRVEEALEPDRPRTRPGARWVSGVGWVHEGDGVIPDTARWVPGVGYVLED